MLNTQKLKLFLFQALIILAAIQTSCASYKDDNSSYYPPVAQPNYCSQYLCLALAPLFKEDDFINPEIKEKVKLDSKIEYLLDYKSYGSIILEVFQENQELTCSRSDAHILINKETRTALDMNCFSGNHQNKNVIKITYLPNELNEVDEFKFLSLISHVWIGVGNTNDIEGKTPLPMKFLLDE